MGAFNSDGSLAAPVHSAPGGGTIDWTKAQSYAGAYQPSAQVKKQPTVTFGTIAHSFLSGVQQQAMQAVRHPLKTAADFGKGIVDSAVNDVKTVADLPVNAVKGVYHLGAAAGDAIMGNKDAAMKHIQQLNADYQNSYIGKTYGSKKPGDLSGLGSAASFGLDAATLGAGGSVAKEGIKGAAEAGGKSFVKAVGKGAAENAAIGGGYGGAQALQENDVSKKNLAKDVGTGAVTGAAAGGVLGTASHILGKAIDKWVNLRTETAAKGQVAPPEQGALPEGQKQLALPPDEQRPGIPAQANGGSANEPRPIDSSQPTEIPGGGVMNPNAASPETAAYISRLNQQLHNMQLDGTAVSPDSKVVTPGAAKAPADKLQQLSRIATTRNTAAAAVDSLAKDRATMLQQQHTDMGGVDTLKETSGTGSDTYSRVSRNDQFYSKTYKETGKPPATQAWLDEAHRQLSNGKDEQAQHYQAAAQVAEAAHALYVEKAAGVKTTDVYAPKTTPDKVAQTKQALAEANAKAGQERVNVAPKAAEPTAPAHTPEQLKAHLEAIQSGHAPGSEIQALHSLIEHPDVSNEDKAHYIQQRDALKPSAQETPAPTGNPGKTQTTPEKPGETAATTARKQKAASMTQKRQPVYADDYVQESGKAKPSIRQKLATDAKAKAAASGEVPVGKESDVTAPSGSRVEKAYDKATGGKGSGLINPSRAASRAGNVKFARTATDLVSSKRQRTYVAKQTAKELSGLMKGLNHDDVNKVVEGGTTTDARVQAAANFFKAHRDVIGTESKDAGTIKGEKENYLPHVAKGLESRKSGGARGLSKNTRFNIERHSIEHLDDNGKVVKEDKYKTLDAFDAAVKKIDSKAGAERDTSKLLEHLLTTEGHAVENAKTVERLMDTRMVDGRPVLARTTESNLNSQKFKDYAVIDNKLVHPDAKNLYEAISKSGRVNNPFATALTKTNVLSKRLVTLNGIVHAVKIWQSSFASQGVARSVWAIGSRGATKEDFIRALGYGAKFARASNDNLFDEVGKATGLLGKLEKVTDPLTHALFHQFGDRQGMSAFKYVEAKAKKMGLSDDEAGRLGADAANQVMHFVPEDQQSIVARQASQLALFAGQFLQNTMKTATNAAGVGLDRTLSKEGQKAAQKLAITRVARMFAYSFAASQALNLATTGKYTWQNGNGDPLNPIWYQTRNKGYTKSYRITNMYGQLKDVFGLLTNPAQETQNKLAPGARELVSQVANTDLFTGNKIAKSTNNEAQQLMDRMVHAASNIFTPAGINLSTPSKQPGLVQAARDVGINSSSVAANDHTDYTKLANDKAAAQKLEAAYKNGNQSKLAAMQALKASGNDYFDKFFAANPTLDPTNKNFAGFKANDSKEVAAGISQGFNAAKANHTTLAYMQSIQQSGSKYFQKFFAANPTLDPTSDSYQPKAAGSNKAKSAQLKYAQKGIKYAGEKFTKAKGKTGPRFTKTSRASLTKAAAPTRARKTHISKVPSAPKLRATKAIGVREATRPKKVKL